MGTLLFHFLGGEEIIQMFISDVIFILDLDISYLSNPNISDY